MLKFIEDKNNHKISCPSSEAKTLSVLRQILGKEDSDSQDVHIWTFSSDKAFDDAQDKLDKYDKEHNSELDYVAESVFIKKEIRIPGTDIILEKGDVIKVMPRMKESDPYYKYLNDVHNTKEYQAYSKAFAKLGYFNLYTLKNGNDVEVGIRPNWESKNNYHPEIYYDVRHKEISIQTTAYGQMGLLGHQMFINQVTEGHKAAELLVRLMNDEKYWNAIPDISTYA